MSNYETLTHPDIFESIPLVGERIAVELEQQGQELLAKSYDSPEKLTIAIRTLNEADSLAQLFETIQSQRGLGDTQFVVVDNESSDNTADVARSFGAEVVTLPRHEFNYAHSMNLCMEAADNNNVYMTVGHAMLASTVALEAGKRLMEDDQIGGVFAVALPGINPSGPERIAGMASLVLNRPGVVKPNAIGLMGATNAVFRKNVWRDLGGFDERYQNGGEDAQLGKKIIDGGLLVVREPLITVHHSHRLGPINYARQVKAWIKMGRGDKSAFDLEALKHRRPDIDFS